MAPGYTVLSIDDDKFMRGMIRSSLEGRYHLLEAESGAQGIEIAKTKDPDIIVLDVEMPGMNGYEVCDALKHTPETKDIPVIFLSSLTNLTSRMQGYEVGGADFLIKPFDAPEIEAKIKNLINISASNEVLKEQANSASNAAYVAMKGSSELGLAIQFVEHIFSANTIDSIAKRFFSATQSLDLRCNLMFVDDGKRTFFDHSGKHCRPLEQEVMSTIFERGGRIVDFGSRSQFNFAHVAVLVKNMPLGDMETYGRIKDLLPAMLGAIDSKVRTIEIEHAIARQTQQLATAFGEVQSTLAEVGEEMERNQNNVIEVLRGVLDKMEQQLPLMGLEEDQEKFITDNLDDSLVAAQAAVDSGERSQSSFKAVIKVLQKLTDLQRELAEQVQHKQEEDEVISVEDGVTGEVELF